MPPSTYIAPHQHIAKWCLFVLSTIVLHFLHRALLDTIIVFLYDMNIRIREMCSLVNKNYIDGFWYARNFWMQNLELNVKLY